MITEANNMAAYLLAKHLTGDQTTLAISILAVAQRSDFAAHVSFNLAEVARDCATEASAQVIQVPNLALRPELVDEACKFAQAAINLEETTALDVLEKWLHAQTEQEHYLLIATVLHILVGAAANTAEVKACAMTAGVTPSG